jgi:DNA-binding MarR family transcriptional regulator
LTDAAALARELERLFSALVREGGRLGFTETVAITPTQRVALFALVDHGALRLGALADAIATTDATATRTVQALERLGLVEREPDPADGRGIRVAATAEGRRLVVRARRRFEQVVARLVPADEQERLSGLLRDLTGAVAPDVSSTV